MPKSGNTASALALDLTSPPLLPLRVAVGRLRTARCPLHPKREPGKDCHYPKAPGLDSETLRPAVSCGEIIEPAAHLVNPLHHLGVGPEQQDGAVVDADLHVALVVLDS